MKNVGHDEDDGFPITNIGNNFAGHGVKLHVTLKETRTFPKPFGFSTRRKILRRRLRKNESN